MDKNFNYINLYLEILFTKNQKEKFYFKFIYN